MKLSIAIPLYNEEERFPEKIVPYLSYLRSRIPDYELVLVDDGSTDDTRAVLERLAAADSRVRVFRHEKNLGRGAGMKTAVLAASGDLVLETDADLPVPPNQINRFVEYLSNHSDCGMVIGSRAHHNSEFVIAQPLRRRFAGWVFHGLFRLLFGVPSWDVMCGFKLFRRDAVQRIFTHVYDNRYLAAAEVVLTAERLKIHWAELPVSWEDDRRSKVKMVRDTFGSLVGLAIMFIRYLRGAYDERPNRGLVWRLVFDPPMVIRYLEAGTSAAVVNLGLLYFLTEQFGVWYLLSATIAFAAALVVSFLAQKFWTFQHKDRRTRVLSKQFSLFVILAAFNLALNAFFVYVFVESFGFWYVAAQVASALLIALWSFFIYHLVIFHSK